MVTILDADNGVTGTPSTGTLSYPAIVANGNGATTQNVTYTVSGLTIDGTGTADDSVDITFSFSSGTTTGVYGINWQGSVSVGGSWVTNQRTLTLAYDSISVNLSGGTDNGAGTFLVISEYTINSWNAGDEATLNGASLNYDTGDTDAATAFSPGVNSVALTHVDHVGAGSFRFNSFDFAFEADAVPEPSSTALLGLGGLALILRRRKA